MPSLDMLFRWARYLDAILYEEYEGAFSLVEEKNGGFVVRYTSFSLDFGVSMDDLRILKRLASVVTAFHVAPAIGSEDLSMLEVYFDALVFCDTIKDTDLNAEYAAYCADHPVDSYRQGKNIGDLFMDLAQENGLFD